MTRNWTHEESDYVIDERYNEHTASGSGNVESGSSDTFKETIAESNCRVYHGNYLLSASALFTFDDFTGIGVVCKCPGNIFLCVFPIFAYKQIEMHDEPVMIVHPSVRMFVFFNHRAGLNQI